MENKRRHKKLKPIVKHLLFSFFIVLFSGLSYFLLIRGLDNKTIIKVSYKEDNKIDYKVYLKPNTFFETPYLPKDSTYISSLIDYIDTDYNFQMKYDQNVVGTYTYFIRGTLIANKSDSDNKSYLTKEYNLTDKVSETINNTNSFTISQNIKIDYQKYNELLTEFKKEYGLTIDGRLKVELVVNSTANYAKSSKPIVDSSSMNIEIPLTQQSVDISINANPQAKSNSLVLETITNNDSLHMSYLIGGSVSVIITLILIILLIKEIRYEKNRISKYHKDLIRILTTYDSIIVTIDKIKDLSSYNLIKVNSFEELLDAHNEIRMPINFIEISKNEKSLFFLINDNIAWVYELKNEIELDYEKD